jgi:DNA-binding CsgD family transcriptional regulator
VVPAAALAIVGREDELAAFDEFFDAGDPPSRALVLDGDPGIGKTTLWQYAVARARAGPSRVLSCAPARSEAPLAYSSLRDLFDGVGDEHVSRLPSPQRRALEVALLRADPGRAKPDQGAISAAVLGVLRLLADLSPVLLAIDDAQWLDPESAAVLGFVVRRIDSVPVSLLVASRGGADEPAALGLDRALPVERVRRIHIGPLSLGALHRMLNVRLDKVFPRPTLRRLHEVSGGNPFFALELARALERRGEHAGVSETLPVPERLNDLVGERLAALPDETFEVVQVAAALSNPTIRVVTTVAGVDPTSVDAAVEAQVIEVVQDSIRFSHPLLGSVAYAALGPSRRRELHARLAGFVDGAEERATHLALATEGVDASVAAELEEAAHLARARGAPAAAAGLAEHARRLTPPENAGHLLRRTMEAAGFHYEAGDAALGRALLEEAVASAAPGPQRAEALKRLARAHAFEADLRVAATLYRGAIDEAGDAGATRADAEAGLGVALMRMLVDLPAAMEHARRASQLAERGQDARGLAEFLSTQAVIEALTGEPGASQTMARAVEVDKAAEGAGGGPHAAAFLVGIWGPAFMPAVLGTFTDDLEGARRVVERARAQALEHGDEASLPLILRYLAYVELLEGNWETAGTWANEGYEVAVQTGQVSQQAVLAGTRALIDAHRGREEETRSAAAEALRLADDTAAMFARLLATSALGLLELSLGNAAAALEQLEPLVEDLEAAGLREPAVARFVPDTIHALLAVGRSTDAEALLARFEGRAARLNRPSALAASARCRGLIQAASSDFDAAIASMNLALEHHERIAIPFDRARTLLALGATYRRGKQKAAARTTLDEAVVEFERLGAALWVQEARAQLARIGGRAPSGGKLTPTEQRVADLVVEGLSNKQVAAALFVTPKTVDTQLSRIYAKLGIHSRAQLARRLAREPGMGKL